MEYSQAPSLRLLQIQERPSRESILRIAAWAERNNPDTYFNSFTSQEPIKPTKEYWAVVD